MSNFRWLFGKSGNSDTKGDDQKSSPPSSSPSVDLVTRIKEDYLKLQELDALCESQTKALQRLTAQTSALRDEITNQKARHGKEMTTLHQAAARRKNELRKVQSQLVSAEKDSAKLTASLRDVNHQLIELKFENEFLKCTTTINDTQVQASADQFKHKPQAILPATPFVAVLIDGDAYQWNLDHYNVKHTTPGAYAAQCIKEEVQKYLLTNSDRIPLQSRIVVRAVCNAGEPRRSPGTKKRRPTSQEFMLHFTESMPLFDFFDAGKGKERADEKLKGCTDNGFARLLEQYCNNLTARQKIVLVHPGYITSEIERFDLTNLEWPLVFARRKAPQCELIKLHRHENKHLEMERRKAIAKEEGERKYGKTRYAQMLIEAAVATQVKDLCHLDSIFSSRFGIGLCQVQHLQTKDIGSDHLDDGEDVPSWDLDID